MTTSENTPQTSVPLRAIDDMMDTINYQKPSKTDLRKIAAEIDFSRVLAWHDVTQSLDQFWALVDNPPLHSVVIEFGPDVAKYLLDITNVKNRQMRRNSAAALAYEITSDNFEVTGDTLKFAHSGQMLDGQHRLDAARRANRPLISHVVFGLHEAVFDVLDQGPRRSPADVLHIAGVPNPVVVAGGVRSALFIKQGGRARKLNQRVTPRVIREYATGEMADMQRYAAEAKLLNQAFKHPPSMMLGLLFKIGEHDPELPARFVQQWVYGARVGANMTFDVLKDRLDVVAKTGGGHIHRNVRLAMIIQAFNHWNAGLVAKPRALTWRKEYAFPKLEFDAQAFVSGKKTEVDEDASLAGLQLRMLIALGKSADRDGNVTLPTPELARLSRIPAEQVTYVLSEMRNDDLVHRVRRAGRAGPAIWRLKEAGLDRLKEHAAGGKQHQHAPLPHYEPEADDERA